MRATILATLLTVWSACCDPVDSRDPTLAQPTVQDAGLVILHHPPAQDAGDAGLVLLVDDAGNH